MNRVILVGRLVKDPELKKTNTDVSVCQFTIAVNRPFTGNSGDKQADFISCVAWRVQADNLCKYMHKGSQIGVEGRLQVRNYEDAGGVKRYVTEVICDQITFLESKSNSSYNDVNNYEIPQTQASRTNDPFANLSNGFGGSNSGNQSNDDPFAGLKTSSGISDDDLPF